MKIRIWVAAFAALAAIAVAVVVVGLGDDDTASASGNAADAAFITDMTAHHQGAIAMARVAQKRADHPEIRRLADAIVADQEGEISVMRTIRRDMHGMGQQGAGHMGMSDAEMGMDTDPAMLEDAEPFDRAFIDMMVPHHEGRSRWPGSCSRRGSRPTCARWRTTSSTPRPGRSPRCVSGARAGTGRPEVPQAPMADHDMHGGG